MKTKSVARPTIDEHELILAKAARDEWMAKWQAAERRIDAVWNDALQTARMRLGHHVPRCFDKCFQCWFFEELGTMFRGDPNNYVPIKERARAEAASLVLARKGKMKTSERDAYARGVTDLLFLVEKMLGDRE